MNIYVKHCEYFSNQVFEQYIKFSFQVEVCQGKINKGKKEKIKIKMAEILMASGHHCMSRLKESSSFLLLKNFWYSVDIYFSVFINKYQTEYSQFQKYLLKL